MRRLVLNKRNKTALFNNRAVLFKHIWGCMEVKKPSIAVAENIGFRIVLNYVFYNFSFE